MKIVARPGKNERPGRSKTWVLYWEVRGEDKRRQKTETFHGSKAEAERRWLEVRRKLDAQAPAERQGLTLAMYLDRWLEGRVDLKRTTWHLYSYMNKKYITPGLGKFLLDKITATDLQEFLVGLDTPPRQVQTIWIILRSAFRDAVTQQRLVQNPMAGVRAPRVEKTRVKAFTPEELRRLLQAAEGTPWLPFLQLACDTGLRRGELLGLKWQDIDFANRRLFVRQTVNVLFATHKTVVQTPKTRAGVRTVLLTNLGVQALETLRQRKSSGPWVFSTRRGTPYDPHMVSEVFRSLRTKAGVRRLPFHALRHSNVSLRIAAGVPIALVSKQIGHASIQTTVDLYADLLPDADREATMRLDAYLKQHLDVPANVPGPPETGGKQGAPD